MVTLQKKFTNGPNYKLVRGMDAQNTIHTVNNQVFCDTIDNYIGWTIIDYNNDDESVNTIINNIYIASYDWFEGLCSTCIDLVEDTFDLKKQILLQLIGKTICAVGLIDDPDIIYYQNVVKKINIAKVQLLEKTQLESSKAQSQEVQQSVLEVSF